MPFLVVPKVSKRPGAKSNHCGMTMMTMIALVFKMLIIMMMMMMMMMTIVVMGKMITIKMIRITQENDRNVMMMIENVRVSRTLDPEKLCEFLVGPSDFF